MTAQTAESNHEADEYRGTSPALRRHVDPDPTEIASLAVRVRPNGPKSLRLAPRVFRARCPGMTSIHIDRVVEEIKSSTGGYVIPFIEQRGLQVEVVTAHGGVPSSCGRSFDPPRKRIQGELRGGDFGLGILLSVGERFTIIAPGAWRTFRGDTPRRHGAQCPGRPH